jgi:undecaprenyl-phosphate galactose phosphotransferase
MTSPLPHDTARNAANKPAKESDIDALAGKVVTLARALRVEKPEAPTLPPGFQILPDASRILEKSGQAFLIADIVSLIAAFILGGVGAWATNMVTKGTFQEVFGYYTVQEFIMFAGLGGMALIWLDSKGHYRQRLPYWEKVGQILAVTLFGIIAGGFIQFAMKNALSRLWMGLGWTFFAIFLLTGRSLVRKWLAKNYQWQIPALLVGNGPTAEAAMETISRETSMGFNIITQVAAEDLKKLSRPRAWRHLMLSCGAGYIFLALEGGQIEQYQSVLKSIARERLPYSVVPPWMGLPSSTLSPHHFLMRDVMLLHETNKLNLPVPRFIKRSFDIVLATLGVIALSPLFAVITLLTRRDGGPAFYTQPRVGLHGKLFNCYKFRSMRVDADAVLQKYLDENAEAAAEWQQFQKLKNDPRITKFGDFIRRTSIDELPQLFNVIKGEMSLVGPRPIMRGQERFYEDDFMCYESVRPGITGPWQVSGRNQLTFKQRVSLESWYARNWSLWLDIVILMKTVPALLKKNQAF